MHGFSRRLAFRRARRGLSFVYVGIAIAVLFGIASMSVEVGRVRTAKAQLSTAADGAALASAAMLPSGDYAGAETTALEVATANHCENAAITMVGNEDVQFGLYRLTTRTFTPEGSTEPNGNDVTRVECNAVRVYTRRTAARGNPLNLTFARVVGHNTHDVLASAIAFVRGGRSGAGIVGLDWVRMTGTTMVDSYDTEPYDPLNPNANATVASNGDITMVGTCEIFGDAHPGVDGSLLATSNTTVTGWASPLEEPLDFPPVTVPAGTPNSGLLEIRAHEVVTLAAGTYWFTEIRMRSHGTLVIEPQVKLYCTGDIDLEGGTVTNPGTPADLEIFGVGTGNMVDLGGGGTLKAHVYAPEADVRLHGTGQDTFGFYGWVIGKTLEILGNSEVHYDETLSSSDVPIRTMLVK
jgi:Flp pilus assembly protein TadG